MFSWRAYPIEACNRPFLSSKHFHFQKEAKCKPFFSENEFYLHKNETNSYEMASLLASP